MTTKAFQAAVLAAALAVGTTCPSTALATAERPREEATAALSVSLETDEDGTITATVENRGGKEAQEVSLKVSAPKGTVLEESAEDEALENDGEERPGKASEAKSEESPRHVGKSSAATNKAESEKGEESEKGPKTKAPDGKAEEGKDGKKAEDGEEKASNVLEIEAGDLEAGESAVFEISATASADEPAEALTVIAKATARGSKASWATARLSAEGATEHEAAATQEEAAEAGTATPKPAEASALSAAESAAGQPEQPVLPETEATALSTARTSEAAFEIGTSSDVTDAAVGDTVRIVVRVRNVGAADARNVLTRSVIPNGMAVVEGSVTEGGRADAGNGFVEWSAPTIAAGAWMEYSYEATVTQALGAVTTQASCEADASGKAGTAATLANTSQGATITTAGGAGALQGDASPQGSASEQTPQASSTATLPKTGDKSARAVIPASAAAFAAAVGALALKRDRKNARS